MQLYKYDTSHDGTHGQAWGQSVDAALLDEEHIEVYSTPTPKGWCEARKVIVLIDWLYVFFVQQPGSNIYTGNLNMNPTQIRLITILEIKKTS